MHRSRPAALAVVAFVALTALAACGGRQSPPPDDAPADAVALFEATMTRAEAIGSVRAIGDVEYYGDDGRVRIRQVVLARAPGDVRIEAISPFDTTLSVLVLNESELAWYDVSNETFATGAPTTANLARIAPLVLSPEDIVRVMRGGPPLEVVDPDLDTWSMAWDGDDDRWALIAPTIDGGTLTLHVEHGSWVLSGARLRDADGETVFELRTGNFIDVRGDAVDTIMPSRIRFLMPAHDVDVSLDIERWQLDPDLADPLFELAAPREIEVISLDP